MLVNLKRWLTAWASEFTRPWRTASEMQAARVGLLAEGDRIVICMPVRFTLDELLAGVTPEAMRDAFDWGDDRGRERID